MKMMATLVALRVGRHGSDLVESTVGQSQGLVLIYLSTRSWLDAVERAVWRSRIPQDCGSFVVRSDAVAGRSLQLRLSYCVGPWRSGMLLFFWKISFPKLAPEPMHSFPNQLSKSLQSC